MHVLHRRSPASRKHGPCSPQIPTSQLPCHPNLTLHMTRGILWRNGDFVSHVCCCSADHTRTRLTSRQQHNIIFPPVCCSFFRNSYSRHTNYPANFIDRCVPTVMHSPPSLSPSDKSQRYTLHNSVHRRKTAASENKKAPRYRNSPDTYTSTVLLALCAPGSPNCLTIVF
jgi:hypothetical protein